MAKKKETVYGTRNPGDKPLPQPEWQHYYKPAEDGIPYFKRNFGQYGKCFWWCLAFFNQLFGIVVILIAVILTIITDLFNPSFRRSFSIFCVFETIVDRIWLAIRKLLDIPWLIVNLLNGDTWVDLLETCLKQRYFLLTWWLDSDYNAQLYYRADRAVFIYARAGRAGKISRLSGVKGPDKDDQAKREISFNLVSDFRLNRRDQDALEFLKQEHLKGADLSWPDPLGTTVLSVAIKRCYIQCVMWLLDNGQDPNRQDHYGGNTGMHKLVQRISKRGDARAAAMMKLLVDRNKADFTIVNYHGDAGNRIMRVLGKERGRTPYMLLRNQHKYPACVKSLRPKPSFQQLEKILQGFNKETARSKCADIYRLINRSHHGDESLHHLRVMDMLFCSNEGTNEELERRQKVIFAEFLSKVLILSTEKLSEDQQLTPADIKLLHWMYYQSAGPPGTTKKEARGAYFEAFEQLMKDAQKSIEKRYEAVYQRLQSQQGKDEFFSIGKELYYDWSPVDMKHSTCMQLPDFIRNQNGIQAIRDLKAVGAIEDTGDFCDIMQGRHKLFGKHPIIGLFLGDPNKTGNYHCIKGDATLWRSLLLLWQICLQEKIKTKFKEDMEAIAHQVDGDVKFMAGPIKGFLRSFEKTEEYGDDFFEDVDASMRVIDGLRCTFLVDNISQNLKVGEVIAKTFAVARTKNGHQKGHVEYADRKYNVVYETEADDVGGMVIPVKLLCEIQILFKEYHEIKEDGHLLYEFQREPVSKAPLNLRSGARDAKNAVCAFWKFFCLSFGALIVGLLLLFFKEIAGSCKVKNCSPGCQSSNYSGCQTCDITVACPDIASAYDWECYYAGDDWDPVECFCELGQDKRLCGQFNYNDTRAITPVELMPTAAPLVTVTIGTETPSMSPTTTPTTGNNMESTTPTAPPNTAGNAESTSPTAIPNAATELPSTSPTPVPPT